MGKKKIEKIEKIENLCTRKVTYCKRKKGLLKKSMELSLLCDLKVVMYIYDKNQRRVIHYASDANQDIMEIFNEPNQREFFTNMDYEKVGGRKTDVDFAENSDVEKPVPEKNMPKIFSQKRIEALMTSQVGSLLT